VRGRPGWFAGFGPSQAIDIGLRPRGSVQAAAPDEGATVSFRWLAARAGAAVMNPAHAQAKAGRSIALHGCRAVLNGARRDVQGRRPSQVGSRELVEAAGIEPASANDPNPVLHA